MAPDRIKTMSIEHLISFNEKILLQEMNSDEYDVGLWEWPVKAPNGKIYCPPAIASRVLCINPKTEEISLIGDVIFSHVEGHNELLRPMYCHAVLAKNGCIYAVPLDAQNILKIDPETETISFIPYPRESGAFRCVLGFDDNIYFSDHSQIYQLNPSRDTVSAFGPVCQEVGGDGVDLDAVARNGKIYATSGRWNHRLVFDPDTSSWYKLRNVARDFSNAGILSPDGNKILYLSSMGISIVDSVTDLVTRKDYPYAPHPRGPQAFHGVPNGKIYELPGGIERVLEYTLEEMTCTAVGPSFSAGRENSPWSASIVGKDGCVYGIPNGAPRVLCVDATTSGNVIVEEIGPTLSGKSWFDGLLAENGKIYCIPEGDTSELLVINTSRWVHIGEHVLLRALMENGRAELKMGGLGVDKPAEASEVQLLDYFYYGSPKGIFSTVVSFM